jgi:hypothetical protein
MFGVFKSPQERAVQGAVDFTIKMLEPYGKIPAEALRDPYCLGFLQIVSGHVASQSLKSASLEQAMGVFTEALKQFAPRQAQEVAEILPIFRAERSPHNETYLGGRRDGDLYMGYKLLNLAPRHQGEAALGRFFDRVKEIDDPSSSSSGQKSTSAEPQPPGKHNDAAPTNGEWMVQPSGPSLECELARTYRLPGIRGYVLTFKFLVRTSNDMNQIHTDLRVHLKPYRISANKPLVMGLITSELKGGLVEVEAIPDEWNEDSDVGLCVDRDDVLKCLRAVSSGQQLTFMLFESLAAERDPFLDLPLRPTMKFELGNDQKFKQLYAECLERVATSQDATRARHIREGWYRRRMPFK